MRRSLLAGAVLALAACGGDRSAAPKAPTLTISASMLVGPAALAAAPARTPTQVLADAPVDPASFTQTFYKLYLSSHADCSGLTLAAEHVGGKTLDILDSPEVFSASPAAGSYPCLAIEQSDILHFVPATTSGVCAAGTEYATDIYREGETDWLDINGVAVPGHGTDATPVNDHTLVLITTDPAAAVARGYSVNQVTVLGSPLVVPSAATFQYDGRGTVVNEPDNNVMHCRINSGVPSFH